MREENEEQRLRMVAFENARSIRIARERAEKELLRSQEALRRSQQELTDFIEDAPIPMTWVGPDGTILWANHARLEMLGYSKEEIIGRRLADFHVQPHRIEEVLRQLMKGETVPELEARLRRKDGSIRDVLITASAFCEDGKFVHASFFTRDITDRKRDEQARATLAAIVESSGDAIISKDLNGIITSWNYGAERLFGYAADEAIGQRIEMLIPPERIHEEPGILERIRAGTRVEHYETIRRRKDGTLVDISLTVSPIRDARGQIVGASKIARDISERKRTEAELKSLMRQEREARAEAEAANRVKNEFMAMISHELRTPLNAIMGWVQLLKSGKLNQPEIERAIQTIDRNAMAQSAIINELLDVARIISGKLKIDMKSMDLAAVIEAAIDVVRSAADAKNIEIVASLDGSVGPIAGDATRLQQVIWNLLSNAIKFTPKLGRVEVRLQRAGTHVQVVVSDTGAGIPKDFLPHVFERFKQADASVTKTHGGLGLGLSIARNLVEMHGGSIRAESEGEGRGATFTISFPVMAVIDSRSAARQSTSAARAEAQQALSHDNVESDLLNGMRILAVDDQPDTRDLIILALTQYGAEVRSSSSASEALQMIKEWKPDVLISDIGMPDKDGYDLMRSVRALEPESGGLVPAIALTGFAGAVDESNARTAGYQLHMAKPVEISELAATVAELSGKR